MSTWPAEAPIPNAASVENRLHSGESLLWSGRPDPSKHFTAKDAFLIPFTVLWAGFAIFWEASVFGMTRGGRGPGIVFILFGAVFVAVGLYMVIGRFFVKAAQKRKTYYWITTERAIITKDNGSWEDVILGQSPVRTRARGTHGDVSFVAGGGPLGIDIWENTGMPSFASRGGFGFYDVKDPQPMFDALRRR
ncbi:hypothetical protein [Falsarthrobacter nasiphocae]|uniref:PH domain-containing protein n=1 Tax=Falsarthrobacter nasiphocae TaxID=189863 RepID=A0AAE3YHB1_9MICC|nr:hypothetical protein [Falsarthrobacter nasiphocae]MDR6891928.1 hypothetical protein [Falsarthrobacter nasiphocae]